MKFETFSPQQLTALTWWVPGSPHHRRDAIICDGAVRSGKTLCTGISFIAWAMFVFDGQNFALCGKTIKSLRRNVTGTVLPVLSDLGFQCREHLTGNRITVQFGGRENQFYLFGGRDESSAALIQGITLAGVLLDEVVLMPRSFVEQACARCSVTGSKLWFSCNPESPQHWFYKEWVCRAEEKNALYLHFDLDSNPGLSPEILRRYHAMYSGVFYRRFVLGQWVMAEGQVYDFFDESFVEPVPGGDFSEYRVSCDYGTSNPASFGLWGEQGGVWYRIDEYYYDSRKAGRQKTDREYVEALKDLVGDRKVRKVIVDPSAASFIQALGQAGFPVEKASNQVLQGIRVTADLMKQRKLVICQPCGDAIREFSLYRWEDGRDAPVKEHDHAMDDIRYFAMSLAREADGFVSFSVERTLPDISLRGKGGFA